MNKKNNNFHANLNGTHRYPSLRISLKKPPTPFSLINFRAPLTTAAISSSCNLLHLAPSLRLSLSPLSQWNIGETHNWNSTHRPNQLGFLGLIAVVAQISIGPIHLIFIFFIIIIIFSRRLFFFFKWNNFIRSITEACLLWV